MPARPVDGRWVEEWLSASRFATYLTAARGRRGIALDLYEWNCRTGGALLWDLAHLEVALRNADDAAVQTRWTGSSHWLLAPDSTLRVAIHRTRRTGQGGKKRVDINGRSREILDAAVSKARPGAPVGKVIAELPFGFWRYCTSAGHEKALWVPYLHHAFPAGTSRRDVDERLG